MSGHRFDDITVESLIETGSMKWTRMPGHLAAFVAEMDFGTAPAVTRSLQDSTDKALWGYLPPPSPGTCPRQPPSFSRPATPGRFHPPGFIRPPMF